MNAIQKFNALNGATVSRNEIEAIIDLAKKENNTEIIYRLSTVLNQSPAEKRFELEVLPYKTALNSPRHTGSYKNALDDCGRLRKGYKFANGTVIKVVPKVKKEPKNKKDAQTQKKPANKVSKSKKTTENVVSNIPVATGSIADAIKSELQKELQKKQPTITDIVEREQGIVIQKEKPVVKPIEYDIRKSIGGWSVDEKEFGTWQFSKKFSTKKQAQEYIYKKTNPNGKFDSKKDSKKDSFLAKPKKQVRVTPKATPKKKTALKNPLINLATQVLPLMLAKPTNSKISKIALAGSDNECSFYEVAGAEGKFLQQVERKPYESVVITLDGMHGAGKTTTLYKFMNAFATPGNKCLFISGEEHPASSLAKDKVKKYLSKKAQENIDSVGEVADLKELYDFIDPYEIIFIDSWQKLQRMVGNIRLDEDLRKKFDGKVFVIIFQQTTTGRTKGGAEVVYDGDIIIKMVKENSFADNYAYFDKNRYTKIPIQNIRYNIATGKVYNPNQTEEPKQINNQNEDFNFSFTVS